MPNTPKGLPYPTPDDPVSSGAADIQALANAVDPFLATARRLYMASPAADDLTDPGYAFWPDAASFGGVAVPAWATHANVVYTVTRVYSITAAGGLTARAQVGANVGRDHSICGGTPAYFTVTLALADEIAVASIAGTTTTVSLAAMHPSGAAQMRVDPLSHITLDLEFIKR